MKNFTMVQVGRHRRLFDAEGMPVDLFNRFVVDMEEYQRLSDSTQVGYSEHVANMLDFMCELGLLDLDNPPSPTNAQRAIQLYPRVLEEAGYIDDPQLAQVAESLGRTPISKAACSKHCAAINNFAYFSEKCLDQEHSLEKAAGINPPLPALNLFQAKQQAQSRFEIVRLQQNSLISSCIRGTKLKVSKRKTPLSTKVQESTFAGKDFPRNRLISAINRATNSRDRLLFLMLPATGLRFSEAMKVRLSDIDFKSRSMRVSDPYGARNPITKEELRLPKKGRRTSKVYILAPLKEMLFAALSGYLNERPQAVSQDYLFLHDTPEKYGIPLCTSTPFKTLNGTSNSAFKRAQHGTEKDTEQQYTLHSLRHFYAMWLKNRVQAKNSEKLGLEMYQIQRLMGHKQISTTMRYCHDDQDIVDLIMEVSDLVIEGSLNEIDLDAYYGSAIIKYGQSIIRKSQEKTAQSNWKRNDQHISRPDNIHKRKSAVRRHYLCSKSTV